MKWAFAIQRKIRLAIVLAVMMLFIIMFSLMESYNINRLTKSFNSIYEDRLVPAVDLYSVGTHIHNKRNHLLTFLFTDKMSPAEIRSYLGNTNRKLDTLIQKYENTYLVKAESKHLQRLKKNLKDFQRDEQMLISSAALNKEVAKDLYLNTTARLNEELDNDLAQLTKVQREIGKELLAESVKSQASSNFFTQIQLVITIILGVIIMILVITGKQVMIQQEKYKMN